MATAIPEAGDESAGEGAASRDAGCIASTLPLIVTMQSTSQGATPAQLFVPATYRSAATVFQIDTGSPYTFLHEPLQDGGTTTSSSDMTADAGSVTIGCSTFDLDGIGVVAIPPVGGKPCVGTFGDDLLLASPSKLDFAGAHVTLHAPGVPFTEAAGWARATMDRPQGYVRIHDVALDGTPVQLLIDTGSSNALWLGQQPEAGDTEVDGQDIEGKTVKMYLGTVVVSIGSWSETVPVYRVPSFPYLQTLVDALGGNLDGLLGLSAFARGIVFDTDAHVVRIAP